MPKPRKLKLKTAKKAPAKAAEKRSDPPPYPGKGQALQRLTWADAQNAYLEGIAAGRSTEELIAEHPEWGFSRASQLHLLIVDDEELLQRYLRARRAAIMAVSESILPIVDDAKNDFMEVESERGNVYTKPNHENVQRSRLRVDTRFKLLEALDPSTFGKKLDISNKDGSFLAAWTEALGTANAPVKKDEKTKH